MLILDSNYCLHSLLPFSTDCRSQDLFLHVQSNWITHCHVFIAVQEESNHPATSPQLSDIYKANSDKSMKMQNKDLSRPRDASVCHFDNVVVLL